MMGAAASSVANRPSTVASNRDKIKRPPSQLKKRRESSSRPKTPSAPLKNDRSSNIYPNLNKQSRSGSIQSNNSLDSREMSNETFPRPLSQQGYTDFQDTTRDLTLSRILSADEFLENMLQTDKDVYHWTQNRDHPSAYNQMTGLLGLRGHLQDELLRIQTMLSQWDPHLNALDEFADTHPNIVAHLKELNKKAIVINKMSEKTDIAATLRTMTGDNENQSEHIDTANIAFEMDLDVIDAIDAQLNPEINGIQTRGSINNSALIQPAGYGTEHSPGFNHNSTDMNEDRFGRSSIGIGTGNQYNTIGIGTDPVQTTLASTSQTVITLDADEIKRKHREEEDRLASDFAKKMTEQSRPDYEINNLLTQHAVSMQALRKRQQMERDGREQEMQRRLQERSNSERYDALAQPSFGFVNQNLHTSTGLDISDDIAQENTNQSEEKELRVNREN